MTPGQAVAPDLAVKQARAAQPAWAATPLARRLDRLRRLRHLIAQRADALIDALSAVPGRTPALSLSAEIAPLADAIRFLERRAPALLKTQRLGARGRPIWLFGHGAEISRAPLGVVLVIGPSNYPLMLPCIQAAQALAAGNAPVIKPGAGGGPAVELFAALAREAGIDARLCCALPESAAAARAAIAAGVDKVVLTGSVRAGRAVLAELAERLVPATMELSGSDAVFVLPGADMDLTARSLAWGLTLNAGATCIAPRRVFVGKGQAQALEDRLTPLVARLAPQPASPAAAEHAARLVEEAIEDGARPLCSWSGQRNDANFAPAVLADAAPDMALLREDVFAPVASIVAVRDMDDALDADARCPYALGASVFGPAQAARALALRVRAGVVTINDLIAPTADPRLPFGGFGWSGFGRTRGGDGLLEMTAAKTVTFRRGRFRPQLQERDASGLVRGYLDAAHGRGIGRRVRGLGAMLKGMLGR